MDRAEGMRHEVTVEVFRNSRNTKCKMPPFRDSFRVKDEIRILLKWASLSFINFLLFAIAKPLAEYSVFHFPLVMIMVSFMAIGLCCMALSSTYWVVSLSGLTTKAKGLLLFSLFQ